MEKRDEDLCVDPNYRGPQIKFLKHIPQPNHLYTWVYQPWIDAAFAFIIKLLFMIDVLHANLILHMH